jgi:hypothetical protein
VPDEVIKAETETTIVFRFGPLEEIGPGSALVGPGSEPIGPPGSGTSSPDPGSGTKRQPAITIIATEPVTDPAELDEQQALSLGHGTPEQALAFFQRHGFPQLSTLPSFDTGRQIWIFPEPHISSASGTGQAVGGVTFVTEGSASSGSSGGSALSGIGSPGGRGPGSSGEEGSAGGIGRTDGSPGRSGSTDGSGTTTSGSPGVAGSPAPGPGGSSIGTLPTPAPAPGASPPAPPVPGSIQADFTTGMDIGRAHGRFLADADQFMSTLKADHGGVSLWERMTQAERDAAVARIQRDYRNLPRLPKGVDAVHDKALRGGFALTARNTYDTERWLTKAVLVGFELLKGAIIGAAAAPPAVGIGAVNNERWSDCAAQTASLALRNAGRAEIDPALLRANFGLPRVALSYKDAEAFAKNWFTQLGLALSPTNAVQDVERGRAAAGDYVLFMKGGASGGHVVFASVRADGTMLIVDGQIGVTWTSLVSAQNQLGMQASGAFRIESIEPL